MSMTLGELIAAVMETVGGEYTSNIRRYINKGLLELSADSQVLTRKNITIAAGGVIVLPTDCLIVNDVYFGGYQMSKYPEADLPDDSMAADNTPYYWLKDGSNVILYPNPSTGDTAQLVYVKNDAVLVDDEDTHTLEHADEFLIAFAKGKVLIDTKGLTDEAMYWKQEAETERGRWHDLDRKQERRPRRVRTGRWV